MQLLGGEGLCGGGGDGSPEHDTTRRTTGGLLVQDTKPSRGGSGGQQRYDDNVICKGENHEVRDSLIGAPVFGESLEHVETYRQQCLCYQLETDYVSAAMSRQPVYRCGHAARPYHDSMPPPRQTQASLPPVSNDTLFNDAVLFGGGGCAKKHRTLLSPLILTGADSVVKPTSNAAATANGDGSCGVVSAPRGEHKRNVHVGGTGTGTRSTNVVTGAANDATAF